MGLDAVEIILRAEELFDTEISDEERSRVETVGQFYELICSKLNVSPLLFPVTSEVLPVITEHQKMLLFLSRPKHLPIPTDVLPWSPQSVWDCVVSIFVDQQGLKPEEVRHSARIAKDLGVD
jgi:hypothetical protein